MLKRLVTRLFAPIILFFVIRKLKKEVTNGNS